MGRKKHGWHVTDEEREMIRKYIEEHPEILAEIEEAENEDYVNPYDSDDQISVYDAADIWFSNGQDEDYMFGYTEDELRQAYNS